jgi:hypothetical protein
MEREVFVRYRKHWHACSRFDDIFLVFLLQQWRWHLYAGAGSVPTQCTRVSLGDNKLGYPVFPLGDSRCFCLFSKRRASVS